MLQSRKTRIFLIQSNFPLKYFSKYQNNNQKQGKDKDWSLVELRM